MCRRLKVAGHGWGVENTDGIEALIATVDNPGEATPLCEARRMISGIESNNPISIPHAENA